MTEPATLTPLSDLTNVDLRLVEDESEGDAMAPDEIEAFLTEPVGDEVDEAA